MARRPRDKKIEKEHVRLGLLRATLRLSSEHGFSSVGLRGVAREAGIAPTSFYRHFADIEALGIALVDELTQEAVERVLEGIEEAEDEGGDPMKALAEGLLAEAAEDEELLRFVLAERSGAHAVLRARLGRVLRPLERAMRTVVPRDAPAGAAHLLVVSALELCAELLEGAEDDRPTDEAGLVDAYLQLARWVMREPKEANR